MPKVGVVLSGSGFYDGSEISEAVITLLALDRAGAATICMAPNIDQLHVVNHLSGEVVQGESRNVLVESARIARGKVTDITSISADDLDALVFPGGFGAAKNLCDFAVKGADCSVNPEVIRLVRDVYKAKKPIGFACISPVIASKIFEGISEKLILTIGDDEATANAIKAMGNEHKNCVVQDFVLDKENKIVSTPAYMFDKRISEVAEGLEKWVQEVLKLI